MPAKAQPSNPNHTVNVQIRIPGWLKNQILQAAGNQSLNTWIAAALHEAANRPTVDTPTGRTPTVTDIIADYLTGQTTTAPCGKPWPCQGTGQPPTNVNGTEFCTTCNIRL